MRAIYAASSILMLGLFLYALGSFAAVSIALRPEGGTIEPPPRPLEEAAPEVANLRGDFRRMATEALQQAPMCVNRDAEDDAARPRGRVLIWDVERDDVSDAHGRLAQELRVQSGEEPCTIYLITERDRRAVMDYNYDVFHGGGPAGVTGFRTDLVVCAIDYPSLQPRGRYRINGNGPPTIIDLKEGLKEIDEDWAGNLKRWIDVCVKGPDAEYVMRSRQGMCRHGDEARKVIGECEMLGSLPTLGRFPRKAIVYNLQTDRVHPANGSLRVRADQAAESLLMVLPLQDELVVDQQRRTGRIDVRVALVSFPGAEPLGVYQVMGESWPLPRKQGDTWAPANDPNKRNPHNVLARWVERLCEVKRGLPQGTFTVAADASQLAGTDWLKGPGWLKHNKGQSLTPEQQAWEQMAEACSEGVPQCRALGAAVPTGKLPGKIVVWMDYAEVFSPAVAQKSLPKTLQASGKDSQVLVAMIVGSHFVQDPKGAPRPKTERTDHDLALFTMPGAEPVGLYRVRGETLAYDRQRMGQNAKNPDMNKEIAEWLTRFVKSPASVARE